MTTDHPLVPLTYAGPLAHYGVAVISDRGTTRIVLPPSPAAQRGVIASGLFVLGHFALSYWLSRPPPSVWWPAIWCVLILGVLVVVFVRCGRPQLITITPTRVTVDIPSRGSGDQQIPPKQTMPRNKVYRAYYHSPTGSLFIRGHLQDIIEWPCPYGHLAGEQLAILLRQQLGLPSEVEPIPAVPGDAGESESGEKIT